MRKIIKKSSFVNTYLANLLPKIPDEAYLFDPIKYPHQFFPEPGMYQWFAAQFVKKGTQEVHKKQKLFISFLRLLRHAFVEKKSVRYSITKNWFDKIMIPTLIDEGFLQIRTGFYNRENDPATPGRLSRVYPTEKFIKEILPMFFGIKIRMENYPFVYKEIVKNKNGKRIWVYSPIKSAIPPPHIKKSKKLLLQLSEFNTGAIRYVTDIFPTNLYRVFNGGWKKNGRMYIFDDNLFTEFRYFKFPKTLHNPPTDIDFADNTSYQGGSYQFYTRKQRRLIMVGDEENNEVDFVGLHPRMLYHLKAGIQYDADPYLAIVDDPELRKFIKKVFYCALYSTTPTILIRAIQSQINKSNPNIKEKLKQNDLATGTKMLERMRKAHEPIARCFGTDISLDLCYVESEIMLKAAQELMDNDVHFMMIHDAMAVPKDNSWFAQEIMLKHYRKQIGFEAQVKITD